MLLSIMKLENKRMENKNGKQTTQQKSLPIYK
jgi:hypothetical protein